MLKKHANCIPTHDVASRVLEMRYDYLISCCCVGLMISTICSLHLTESPPREDK